LSDPYDRSPAEPRDGDPVPADEDCYVPEGHDPYADLIRVCCNCGSDMIEHKCKLRCPRCGFYLSCSDHI
jgi:ribosomal protein S27AE